MTFMKQILATALTVSVVAAPMAYAKNNQQQGIQTVTAATVQSVGDDRQVTITGKIVRFLGNEKFELQDQTGTVIVEIDDDYYQNPQELIGKTVTINGETDISLRKKRVEIDADYVQFR